MRWAAKHRRSIVTVTLLWAVFWALWNGGGLWTYIQIAICSIGGGCCLALYDRLEREKRRGPGSFDPGA